MFSIRMRPVTRNDLKVNVPDGSFLYIFDQSLDREQCWILLLFAYCLVAVYYFTVYV